jgi:formylglycine-generating enzyme required for sulfatase activity
MNLADPNEANPKGERPAADQQIFAGRFALIRFLGRGGMGQVWLAHDRRLNDEVALKFLPPEVHADPSALDDLRRETARSRKLTHPGIIRIHDLHEAANEAPFIAMEYVDGATLAALRLQRHHRCFSWDYVRPLLNQLCAALDYAHAEHVIHRDLKPANVMLDGRGRLKLADFGIAANISDSVSRISGHRPGSGTLAYMSPQQLTGKRPEVTDDIYSLGATLYELLTGQLPFFSGDIAHQVLHETPEALPPRLAALGIQNDVPAPVAAMIMACLAKDAAHRPQTARAVAGWLGEEIPVPEDARTDGTCVSAAEASNKQLSTAVARSSNRKVILAVTVTLVGMAVLTAAFLLLKDNLTGRRPSGTKRIFGAVPVLTPPFELQISNMVWIPPGTFLLGSPDTDPDSAKNEKPVTQVTLTHGFWMCRHEVTQGEYFALTGTNPSRSKGDTNRPVEQVTWEQARNYCRRLTDLEQRTGRLPDDYVFRLPTEAEWEYACRAGTTSRYGFGDDAEELDKYAWFSANGQITTHPVEQKEPNRWGLYDMHGNVWEWCQDWKGTYPGVSVTDYTGPGNGTFRVNRGGAFKDAPGSCRSASRSSFYNGDALPFLGFRVVVAPVVRASAE